MKYFVAIFLALSMLTAVSCRSALATEPAFKPSVDATYWVGEIGTASYYGHAHQGLRCASGLRFNENELTAAHAWLPFGTRVRVTLAGTDRTVVVTVTDRLYSARRIVDLSSAAAKQLGMIRRGLGQVTLSPA